MSFLGQFLGKLVGRFLGDQGAAPPAAKKFRATVLALDSHGRGVLHIVDLDEKTDTEPFTNYSDYGWVGFPDSAPFTTPATQENPTTADGFEPVTAVARGVCTGLGVCSIQVTNQGHVIFTPGG